MKRFKQMEHLLETFGDAEKMDMVTYCCWRYGWDHTRPSGLYLALRLANGNLCKFKKLAGRLNSRIEKMEMK